MKYVSSPILSDRAQKAACFFPSRSLRIIVIIAVVIAGNGDFRWTAAVSDSRERRGDRFASQVGKRGKRPHCIHPSSLDPFDYTL